MSALVNSKIRSPEEWFSPWRFVLLVAALLTACFFSVVAGWETFFFRDYAIFSYPIAAYHRDCFWRGEFPLWNHYNYCGMPFLAQWNTLVLYPFSLFYLLFPLPWSLNVFAIAHLGLAALGMYHLSRQWTASNLAGAVAGLGFAFGGVALSCLKWPNTIAAFAWMPWVVLYCERGLEGPWRRVGIAVFIAAFQMLCGSPEIVLLTWILCAAIAAHRFGAIRSWQIPMKFAAMVLLVSALCAAQLLPFFELLRESQRDDTFAGSYWPIPRWGIINFILPLFRSFPSYHGVHAQPWQYWISTYYVGLPLTILAVFGLIRARSFKLWILAALATWSAWLALGGHGLLYQWLHDLVPGFSMMRFPVKFVLLPAFIVPLLAAVGVVRAPEGPSPKKILGWTSAILGAVIFALCFSNEFNPFAYATPATLSWNGFWRVAFAIGVVAAAIALYRGRSGAGVMIVCLVTLDGITHAPWQNPTAPALIYSLPVLTMQPRPTLGQSRAMISPEAAQTVDHLKVKTPTEDVGASLASLYCNVNLLERIPKVDGFYSLYPARTDELLRQIYHGAERPPPGLLDLFGVTQITAPGTWDQWETREALPLVFAPKTSVIASNAVPHILKTNFNPREIVYVEQQTPAHGNVRISNIRFASGEISFVSESTNEALVVVSQSYNRGWKALVGGKETPILRANHAFQAVVVPAGQNEVTLRYRSAAFRAGSIISAVTGLVLASLVLNKFLNIVRRLAPKSATPQ